MKTHSPTAMVRLCFALLFLRKEQDGIDMPRRLMGNLKGEISDKKLHKCALGKDILSADLYCEDALFPYQIITHPLPAITESKSDKNPARQA